MIGVRKAFGKRGTVGFLRGFSTGNPQGVDAEPNKISMMSSPAFEVVRKFFDRAVVRNYDFTKSDLTYRTNVLYENFLDNDTLDRADEKTKSTIKHMIRKLTWIPEKNALELYLPLHDRVKNIRCEIEDMTSRRKLRLLQMKSKTDGQRYLMSIAVDFLNLKDIDDQNKLLEYAILTVGPQPTQNIDNIDLLAAAVLGKSEILSKFRQS
eukprot:TRINITY_DN137_c0_g2_i3.p1 TRINITY_DN137_c0_g2~~TRINITY_DN137_c0_g2_i3.p1  ORF type:complete len:209 (-),score=39.67 TRINITY_DN137_c0_g2_i3:151-777(-)